MTASTSLNNSVPARDIGYGVVQAITETVSYNTVGIGTADTVIVGALPAGAVILNTSVRITAAFNAATTNVLTVGTSSGSNVDIVAAGNVDETVTGTTNVNTGNSVTFSADTTIYAKYTETGTAATAGTAVIVITYFVPSNG